MKYCAARNVKQSEVRCAREECAVGVSPSAEGDKGCSPLTSRAFEESKQTRKRDLREFASQTVADENF